MAKIEKTTIIGDILDIAPETASSVPVHRHALPGLPSSRGETVEEACMVHGVDPDALLEELNKMVRTDFFRSDEKAACCAAFSCFMGG